jgi:hypothetical protein
MSNRRLVIQGLLKVPDGDTHYSVASIATFQIKSQSVAEGDEQPRFDVRHLRRRIRG